MQGGVDRCDVSCGHVFSAELIMDWPEQRAQQARPVQVLEPLWVPELAQLVPAGLVRVWLEPLRAPEQQGPLLRVRCRRAQDWSVLQGPQVRRFLRVERGRCLRLAWRVLQPVPQGQSVGWRQVQSVHQVAWHQDQPVGWRQALPGQACCLEGFE